MKKPNIKPLSAREIQRILAGDEFLKRLTRAANTTNRTGNETGFWVERDIYDNDLIYGEVIESTVASALTGDPESCLSGARSDSIDALLEKRGFDIYGGEAYEVIGIHFHPSPHSFDPSWQDVFSFLAERELLFYAGWGRRLDHKPISAIGSLPSDNHIELLLLQETGNEPLGSKFVDALHSLAQRCPNDNTKLAKFYDKFNGIRAAMLSFEKEGRLYKLKKGDEKKVARFASRPRFLAFCDDLLDEERYSGSPNEYLGMELD